MAKKNLFFLVALILSGTALLWYFSVQPKVAPPVQTNGGKIQVVTSFYPLSYFAHEIGQDAIELVQLTPGGVEPHDYEPTPQDIIHLQKANVVLLNGAGIENWSSKVLPQLSSATQVVTMSEHVSLLSLVADPQDHEQTGPFDPHFWLDPVSAIQEAERIRDAFVQVDPSHAQIFQQNTAALVARLQSLHESYVSGLRTCQQREALTSHNAFQYVAHRYNFVVTPLSGFSPSDDPSPKRLAELSKRVKEKNIHYVLTETLVSPKFAETLAKETGVQTLVLNPLEGLTEQELASLKNYEVIMQENLQNLQIALDCK